MKATQFTITIVNEMPEEHIPLLNSLGEDAKKQILQVAAKTMKEHVNELMVNPEGLTRSVSVKAEYVDVKIEPSK